MYAPLTAQSIVRAIEIVCHDANKNQSMWIVRRANRSDMKCKSDATEMLYGIVIASDRKDESPMDEIVTTFYLAYSTWDGRILYLDQRGLSEDRDNDQNDTLASFVRLVLAKIALSLECCRLVWQHYQPLDYRETVEPETLHGWLTLHWSRPAIEIFVGKIKSQNGIEIRSVISETIAGLDQKKLKLRLASSKDLDSIERLVHGLADYEKEPDAVNVTKDTYHVDGFCGRGLFYCLLIDHLDCFNQAHTCGMAFFYLGYRQKEGLFLYLEDLFIEEAFRGFGAGSFVMKALGVVGQKLGCSQLLWQALHWNTPALSFYGKIGAEVQDGLRTSRYAGNVLRQFAERDFATIFESIG